MSESKTQWLLYAIMSGACAALNGAFAKLTTTHLTTAWAARISYSLGLNEQSIAVDYLVRGVWLPLWCQTFDVEDLTR